MHLLQFDWSTKVPLQLHSEKPAQVEMHYVLYINHSYHLTEILRFGDLYTILKLANLICSPNTTIIPGMENPNHRRS